MGKLVLSGIKGGLHVLVVEPVAPNSKRPVPGDGRMSFEGRVKSATGTILARRVSTEFLPHVAGDAAFAILVLASLRHESESPMVSQPYMTLGTAAVRVMRVVLTPIRLRTA